MRFAITALLVLCSPWAVASGVYQTPEAFVEESFGGSPPAPKILWLAGALRRDYERIMAQPPAQLRMRHWLQDRRSVWILDAIGKERPITAGFVIDDGRIERTKVLIFRESRGEEVRHPFFTDQFRRAGLNGDGALDRPIDGISGATLSVHAMARMAQLALLLHRQVVPAP